MEECFGVKNHSVWKSCSFAGGDGGECRGVDWGREVCRWRGALVSRSLAEFGALWEAK